MHFNQTTFGGDRGQILTKFYEGVNAYVFSLHFFCNAKKQKQQIPGTYIPCIIPKECLFWNYGILVVKMTEMHSKAK